MILYAKMYINNTSSALCFCPKMSLLHTESHINCCCAGAFASLFGCVVLCLAFVVVFNCKWAKENKYDNSPTPKTVWLSGFLVCLYLCVEHT